MQLASIEISTWYWLALGVGLVLLEVFVPGMLFVWLGVGACVVAIVSVPVKLALLTKLLIWAAVSGALMVLWFKVFRDNDATRAGRAEATLGYVGQLVRAVAPREPGSVRFTRPILGNDVWECESDMTIASGQAVKVVAVVGREGRRVKVMPA